MHLLPKMMLGMVTIVKPDPVIELVITAHSPRNRLIRIAAVMPIVSVQIRQAMAKVIERQKETDVAPVENTKDNKGRDKQCELGNSPKRLAWILALQFLKDGLGIFAEKTEERVFEGMFGFTFVTVLVNRNPIDGLAVLIGTIGVSLVMLHVNAFVENLAKTDRHRLQDTEQTIEQRRSEIRVV